MGGVAGGSDGAVGSVGIGGGDVTGGAEYLAHVLSEVKAVCVPGTVLLDGQRTGGDALRGVPCDEPEGRMVAAGESKSTLLMCTRKVDVLCEYH